MSKILITGGSGFIGRHLSEKLMHNGHDVAFLSRKPDPDNAIKSYAWNWREGTIASGAIDWADVIIHLAGENIGKHNWSRKRKDEILNSRVKSTGFLLSVVKKSGKKELTFICASATGYYGTGLPARTFSEDDPPGRDFLAHVCIKWEDAAVQFRSSGYRTVIIRTGIVLAGDGGMLYELKPLIKLGVGIIPGSGAQQISWIHMEDLCALYLKAVEDASMQGVYNAVAPHPVSYRELTSALSRIRRMLIVRIPAFLLRIILGERSVLILEGSRVACRKIEGTGFSFQYPFLSDALQHMGF